MPGYGQRYWAERTADNRRRAYPKFKGQQTADVVVIGGGLTGAAAAYALANAGLDVILLEADRLATGSTAAGLGAAVPQPDALYRAVEQAAGRRVARTAWSEARRSSHEFGAVLRKLPVKCDVADSALVINARTPEDGQRSSTNRRPGRPPARRPVARARGGAGGDRDRLVRRDAAARRVHVRSGARDARAGRRRRSEGRANLRALRGSPDDVHAADRAGRSRGRRAFARPASSSRRASRDAVRAAAPSRPPRDGYAVVTHPLLGGDAPRRRARARAS